jgi:hypothetical protein
VFAPAAKRAIINLCDLFDSESERCASPSPPPFVFHHTHSVCVVRDGVLERSAARADIHVLPMRDLRMDRLAAYLHGEAAAERGGRRGKLTKRAGMAVHGFTHIVAFKPTGIYRCLCTPPPST